MPIKRWLNDHILAVSSLGVSLLVALLYLGSIELHRLIGLPYIELEYRISDWVARIGKTAPRDPRLYFLADDSPSHTLDQVWDEDFEASPILKRMQQPAWPRDVYAAILERLAGAGARVVGFDYMFKGELPGDAELRAALDKYADRVVIGSHIDDVKRGLQKIPQISTPPKTLIDEPADPRVGFINVWTDEDEKVRRFRFRVSREQLANRTALNETEYESFPARIVRQAGLAERIPAGRDSHVIRFAYKGETLREAQKPQSVANIFIPSLWEANFQNGEFFRDKIVVVGPEGNYTKDVFASPFGIIAGPEFHLNVINAMLTGSFLKESSWLADLLLIFGGGALAYLAGRAVRGPIVRMLLLLATAATLFGAAVALYNSGTIIPVFSPMLAVIGSGFTFIVWQQVIERLEKAKLRKTFERYVSRDIVKELMDNPSSYLNTVGGARKKVTVLFSDVRGFTTMTESGDEQVFVKQLNEYFDAMVNIVFANRGTLDKFIGDAVMAQWGGIHSDGEKLDAIHAVRAAVQMRKSLRELNPKWLARDLLELKIGIGLHHGEAIVGNLGGGEKMEVSLIGDAVNTASRLEGMTKEFHTDLLIGAPLATLVRDEFILRTVAHSLPKGKKKPLEIFTVLDDRASGAAEPRWLAAHEEGVRLFRQREFTAAIERFEDVLESQPEDWLAQDYLEQCREFLETAPPEEWSGVHVMTTK